MLSTSFAFQKKMAQNTKAVFKSTLTLADGTVHELTGTDFMSGPSFSEATSGQSAFDVGAAVMGRHDFVLRNDDGRFDDFDFTGAVVVSYVGCGLDDGTTEWLRKGVYGIDQPDSYGNTIGLQALDNMRLFEKPYSDVATVYPASAYAIVSDVCTACGVELASSFDNGNIVINVRPDDDAMTCLDVISYIAQATGNWAKCDTLGRLCVRWYDTSAFESEDWLDGQFFDDATPYASGDSADGGMFMTGGDNYDGGSFTYGSYINLYSFADLSILTDDVVITGIRVTAQDGRTTDGTMGDAGETALYGSEGYVLDIAGNPFIQYGTAYAAAERIGLRVVGMRFRPFDASVIGNPAYEAGDPVVLTDRKQRQYRSYITSLTYRVGSYEAVSCSAETPSRNSAAGYSAMTKAVVENRNAIRAEKTAREIALSTFALMLSSSSGLYKTEETQEDGSTVYYLHDKPTLAQSQTVWKATADAFGVSTDGGETYSYGVDSNGVAILSRIYAEGINADYINAGSISGDLITGGTIVGSKLQAQNGKTTIDLDYGSEYWPFVMKLDGTLATLIDLSGISCVGGTDSTLESWTSEGNLFFGYDSGSVTQVALILSPSSGNDSSIRLKSDGNVEISASGALKMNGNTGFTGSHHGLNFVNGICTGPTS